LWNIHKNEIGKITGVTNPQDYLNNPEAQEKYQSHLESQYKRNVPGLRKRFPGVTKGIDDEVLMALQHLSGLGDARIYLDTLERTKSYDAAQQALNQSIENRTGQAPPTNKTVFEYLNTFSENLEKDNTPKEPQIFAPKTQPQVNPNPTFTASPFVAPKVTETKPQPQQFVDSRFRVLPEVLPKIEQPKTNKPLTKQEISSIVEEKLKIKPTEEQLNVIMNPNLSWYEKGRQLGIIPKTKSFSGPQSISQPNRLQEAWETLINEGFGALIDQSLSAATSPNKGLEQKIKPIPEPNINNEKSQIVKENKLKPKEEEPSRVALGSRIENYGGDPDRYIEPFKINTNSAKFGVRSRGEEQDIKTEGAVFTTFKPWTYASSPEYVNEFNYYLVVDKANGTLKISTNPKQNKDSLLNDQNIRSNPEMVTTGTYGRLAKSLNLNGNYNDGIETKTLGYINQNNKQASLPTFGIGKDGTELGGYKGGKLILSKPDGSDPVIVYGSAQIVINEFNKYKEKHKLDNVLVLDADGKSYAQSYQTKSKVLKGSKLRSKNWDNANSASAGSGNILYLK
jgi:hypothetical protein